MDGMSESKFPPPRFEPTPVGTIPPSPVKPAVFITGVCGDTVCFREVEA